MNVLGMEIKMSIKLVLNWIGYIIVLYVLLMTGMFQIYRSAKADIQEVLANFPPTFIKAFGLDVEHIFSYGGFYRFSFEYLGLLGGVMAASLAISVFAREKRNKCSEFILTKPISRTSIFLKKYIACVFLIFVTNVIYIITSVILYRLSGERKISDIRIIYVGLGFFYTQMVFLTLGMDYAIWMRKIRSIAGTATFFGLSAFIITSLVNVLEDEKLEILAPLLYFEPYSIFMGEYYKVKFIIITCVIVIASLLLSLYKYIKSDT